MTKISQIDDRSAAAAWSPARKYGDVIALGAKVRREEKSKIKTMTRANDHEKGRFFGQHCNDFISFFSFSSFQFV